MTFFVYFITEAIIPWVSRQTLKKLIRNKMKYNVQSKIQEELASYEDLQCLRKAKIAEKDAPTIGIAELKKRIARRKQAE